MISSMDRLLDYLLDALEEPEADQLSVSRLTKVLFLIDWRATLTLGWPVTGLSWRLARCGPDSSGVLANVEVSEYFAFVEIYGRPYVRVLRRIERPGASATEDERHVIDHVVRETRELDWDQLRQLVYSTYPMLAGDGDLDLVGLADQYKASGQYVEYAI